MWGHHTFVRRLMSFSILPVVGSIYNVGVWDNGPAAWSNTATPQIHVAETHNIEGKIWMENATHIA